MAKFVHFQHERYRVHKKTDTVEFSINVSPKKEKTLFIEDRVSINLYLDNRVATIYLDGSEIESLVYEASRLIDTGNYDTIDDD
jgi:hypothetical protein